MFDDKADSTPPIGEKNEKMRAAQEDMLQNLRAHAMAEEAVPENTIELCVGPESAIHCLPATAPIILGRFSEAELNKAEHLDLTQYFEYGISRRHAMIRPISSTQIVVMDLESKNGTQLNDRPLTPHTPYPLKSGDRLLLGDLPIVIRF